MNQKKQILLLTATVTPPAGSRNLTRLDPRERLDDYCRAFDFYLTLLDRSVDRIVFAENSASDITPLRNMAARRGAAGRVEFLSFYGLDYPPTYDRGYGELKLVDYAAAHSAWIHDFAPDYILWKVTGRYIIKNLDAIIARQPADFDFYINYRLGTATPVFPIRVLRWLDMWLFAWSHRAYQDFLQGIYAEFAYGMEDHFRQLIDRAPRHLKIVKRYRVVPEIEGVRGFDSRSYMNRSNRLKYRLRVAANRLAPWLWI